MASHLEHSQSRTYSESERIINNLVQASSAQNYDPAALIAHYPIDQSILQHENPNNCSDLVAPLPLDKYRLNVDNNPKVIRRKPQEKIQYLQQVAVRYLKPPPPPPAGEIVIKHLHDRQVAPAPALVLRQAPEKPVTPPPIVLREAPPAPPAPLPGRYVAVPGKIIPPPARKVVVERLPAIPPKPQQIFIERWLPYGQQTQKVVYQPARPPCLVPDPKNVVIQWESPDVEIRKEFKNLGIIHADPQEYVAKYGQSLIRSDQLPEVAVHYGEQPGLDLASRTQPSNIPILQGDLHALRLIDLDSVGLGFYRNSGYSNEASYSYESY
jgi:hypothetical protein